MKTIHQQLSDYIDENGYEITTSKGITISSSWGEWLLYAECTLVETDDAELKVSFCCDKKSFVKLFRIRKVKDIYDLTQERLMVLYYEGLAELICDVYVESFCYMAFQKLGERIVAMNKRDVKHCIPQHEKLETPDQFIAYARRYYELMHCNEN